MKKKGIIIGVVFAAFLMLATPSISAVNQQETSELLLKNNDIMPLWMRLVLVATGFGAVLTGIQGMLTGFGFQYPDGLDFVGGIIVILTGIYVMVMGLLGQDPLNKLDGY